MTYDTLKITDILHFVVAGFVRIEKDLVINKIFISSLMPFIIVIFYNRPINLRQEFFTATK